MPDNISPNIGSVNGPAAFGAHAIAMNIDTLIQQGKFTDLFGVGEKALNERQYRWARRAFEAYLRGDESSEALNPKLRAAAFVYYDIATLAGLRPHHRGPQEISDIAQYLVHGRAHPLAPVLAALLRDDTDLGGIRENAELADLAASASVDGLSADVLRFLTAHLAPCAGPTWERLRLRANAAGLPAEAFEMVREVPPRDPERFRLVPRYFIRDPEPPRPVSTTPAIVMLALAVASLLASCLSVSVGVGSTDENSDGSAALGGFCLGVVLLGTSIGLFVGASSAYSRYRGYLGLRRTFEANWHAARPKPTDGQMDHWLDEDTGRIAALGAERHGLRRKLVSQSGSLLDEPQILVGLSSRTYRASRQVTVADPSAVGGHRTATVHVDVPVVQFRNGADGQLRADNYRVLVIYLTTDRVCVFDVELELATRRLVTERRLAFRYRDIVAIEVSTVPAGPEEIERFQKQLAEFLIADMSQVQAIEDERFSLSIVDGGKVQMNIGVGVSFHGYDRRGHPVAWANRQILRNVERQVWDRQGPDRR